MIENGLRRMAVPRGVAAGLTMGVVALLLATPARAALVSACSGVSLPPSTVTAILQPVFQGVVGPLQTGVNGLLGLPLVGGILGGPLNIDLTGPSGLLTNAAAGAPISLSVLKADGTVLGPADTCNTTTDSVQLNTPAGISLGGNQLSGLGGGTPATAGEINSVALGNGATTTPAATTAVALGNGASVSAPNSVALGAGATATRGAANGSAGEVSVGAPGATRQITNVAAGTAPTDAANVGQVGAQVTAAAAAAPIQYSAAAAPTIPTPGVVSNDTTLVGTAAGTPVALHNLAPGVVAAGSTDAVNGGQLATTNATVAANTTTITNLGNGTAGLVQQTGGAPGNGQLTVGAATGGASVSVAGTGRNRTLTGLANGLAGNDAVTVAQVNGLTGGGLNNVQYDPTAIGGRSNTVTLAGGLAGGVTVTNIAAGALTPASTDAVNGGQLSATNAQVTALSTGRAGAFQSNNAAAAPAPVASGANASAGGFGASASGAGGVALGNGATSSGIGSVALGQGSTDGGATGVVSVGGVGSERRVTNVGPAVNGTDAVNLSQLQAATTAFGTTATGLQNQINRTNFDLNQVRRRANGGTAGAMAVAGLPQAFEPGKSMIGGAIGYWADQVAFAVGVSSIVGEHTVVKAGGSVSNQGVGGFNAGVGFQF